MTNALNRITAERLEVPEDFLLGEGSEISATELQVGRGVSIGAGTRITAEHIVLQDGAVIGDGSVIDTKRLSLGFGARLGNELKVGAVQKPAETVDIGDQSVIGDRVVVFVPALIVGDYVTIHRECLINGYKPCLIGHNTWIGEHSVLNSTDSLTIGNNVGIGAYNSIYTHAFNGELLEGCQIANTAPVAIEDNVWLMGAYNVVSPGVTIGERSMVLTSSVVSRSVPSMTTVGGIPARDLTDRLVGFKDITLDQKMKLMRGFVEEFISERYSNASRPRQHGFTVSADFGGEFDVLAIDEYEDETFDSDRVTLAYVRDARGIVPENELVSLFDMSTKTYTKRRTAAEITIISYMNGYRARFVPRDRPRIA